jgi:hypothetical protein
VHDSQDNIITFKNTYNPGRNCNWRVRNVSCPKRAITLPLNRIYGKYAAVPGYENELSVTFEGMKGSRNLYYQAFDIDFPDEVEIYINEHPIGYAPVTGNNRWGKKQRIVLPDAYVNDYGKNIVTFDAVHNPRKNYKWRIANVLVD